MKSVDLMKKGESQIKAYIDEKNNIHFTEFLIGKPIGKETGWVNAGNNKKIRERFQYLEANRYHYEPGQFSSYKSVNQKLSDIVNNSENKHSSMRRVIEIVNGYNTVGSSRIIMKLNGKELTLDDFSKKAF